jgi:dihydrodipicolinate synthase/N-acetylneuraminate lyase
VKKESLASGVIASVMVPFTPDGQIDEDQLRAEVKLLDQTDVDGLCAGGLLSGIAGARAEELYALCTNIRRGSSKPLFAMILPDVAVEALEMAGWFLAPCCWPIASQRRKWTCRQPAP